MTQVRGRSPEPWELGKGVKPILKRSGPGERGAGQAGTRHGPGRSRGGCPAGAVTSTGAGEAQQPASCLGSSFCQRLLRLFHAQPPRPLPPPPPPPSYTGQRPPPPPPPLSALAPAPPRFPAPFATMCWRRLGERAVARALRSQPSSKDAQGAGLKTNGKRSEGRVRNTEEAKKLFSQCFGRLTLMLKRNTN